MFQIKHNSVNVCHESCDETNIRTYVKSKFNIIILINLMFLLFLTISAVHYS